MTGIGEAPQIIGLGMSTLDILVRLDQMPTWDCGSALDDLTLDGGGPAGTAIVTAARFGVKTGMISTVGNDETADLKLRLLEKYGVDTSRCVARPYPEPQVILVCVNSQCGERVFSGSPRTGMFPIQPEEIDQDYLTQADYLHLDGFFPSAAIQAAKWMRAAGKKVTLDAAKTNGPVSPEMRELVTLCDAVISGAGFSQALTGIPEVFSAGRSILDLGPQLFVETLGENGSVTVSRQGEFHLPAFPVEVVDTTGAGDVFHGAYLVGLLRNWNLDSIAQFATAASALKCTRLGGRRGIPLYEEVIEFLAKLQPDFMESTCR